MGRFRLKGSWVAKAAGGVVAGALVAGLAACERTPKEAPEGAAGRDAQAGPHTESQPQGLRLSLPDGWRANPEQDQRLAFGPGRRTVAWLEPAASSGNKLPSTDSLKDLFSAELGETPLATLGEAESEDVVWWMGRVQPEEGPAWTVGLCARRLENGLYLVGTVPGANESEVRAAMDVCTGLGWGDGAP